MLPSSGDLFSNILVGFEDFAYLIHRFEFTRRKDPIWIGMPRPVHSIADLDKAAEKFTFPWNPYNPYTTSYNAYSNFHGKRMWDIGQNNIEDAIFYMADMMNNGCPVLIHSIRMVESACEFVLGEHKHRLDRTLEFVFEKAVENMLEWRWRKANPDMNPPFRFIRTSPTDHQTDFLEACIAHHRRIVKLALPLIVTSFSKTRRKAVVEDTTYSARFPWTKLDFYQEQKLGLEKCPTIGNSKIARRTVLAGALRTAQYVWRKQAIKEGTVKTEVTPEFTSYNLPIFTEVRKIGDSHLRVMGMDLSYMLGRIDGTYDFVFMRKSGDGHYEAVYANNEDYL